MPMMQTFSGLSQKPKRTSEPVKEKDHRTKPGIFLLGSMWEFQEQAALYTRDLGLDDYDDGPQDAFRHAYAASRFSSSFGSHFTDRLGLLYERVEFLKWWWKNGYDHALASKQMDLHNNRAGEAIGEKEPSDHDAMILIYLAIVAGKLEVIDVIQHENGEREYRRRQTDYRDVEPIDEDHDPFDYDNPDGGGFDPDWDPGSAYA